MVRYWLIGTSGKFTYQRDLGSGKGKREIQNAQASIRKTHNSMRRRGRISFHIRNN
jgi:hypothetical protein